MSRLLTEAEWLTPKQALALLRKHDPELTMEDLAGYCTELKLFQVYVRLRMAQGEELDSRASVYGVGEYLVLNPEDALHGADDTTLYLLGDVFDAPDPGASRLLQVEWELSAKRSSLRFLFNRAEMEKAITPAATAPAASAPPTAPSVNHLLVISALVEMLKDDTRPRHNQQSIIETIEDEYGHVHGLGATSLRTLFAEANKARKAAGTSKRTGGTKIRLEKK
ncbi:TPA: hypothetical protein ACQTZV_003158 [Pseudomonas aeruginosa]